MVKVLPMVPSSEGRKNFPEAVPVIAEIPLVLPSSEGCRKLGTTGTTVWFTVEYCQFPTVVAVVMEAMPMSSSPWVLWFKLEPPGSPLILLSALPSPTAVLAISLLSRVQLLEWCRDNSVIWENPVRENTTHYTVEYTCKAVLVVSYHALGCERTCISGSKSLVFICKGLFIFVCA